LDSDIDYLIEFVKKYIEPEVTDTENEKLFFKKYESKIKNQLRINCNSYEKEMDSIISKIENSYPVIKKVSKSTGYDDCIILATNIKKEKMQKSGVYNIETENDGYIEFVRLESLDVLELKQYIKNKK
jgi:hypothetical protein